MKINEKNLCVFARTPPYDIEGFLSKRGEINKSFQRRFFVLKGNLLFYFENQYDREPLGLIIVEGCTIELSHETDSDYYCFEIAFNGNRTYILAADTQESMELWMKALTCAGYEYKRIILAEMQRQLQEIEDSRNKMRSSTSHTDSEGNGKPKPSERRQNPFNRLPPPPPTLRPLGPAPPPPSASGAVVSRGKVDEPPMPMIHGHFGSSQAREQQEQQRLSDNNGNGISPHNTPQEARRHGMHQPTSVFYRDPPKAPPRTKVLSSFNSASHMDDLKKQRRIIRAIEMFELKHESYRKEVMPDIIRYRESQAQPLIQF